MSEDKNDGSIKVYVRIRPASQNIPDDSALQIDELDEHKIRIGSNTTTAAFTKVFGKDTKQPQVFDCIAKPLIDHVLEGYNATLFAYGQTGSGKTYTLTGGDSYEERGIIPRSVAYLYNQIKRQNEWNYTVRTSYIEIYNTSVFNLLTDAQSMAARGDNKLDHIEILESGSKIILKTREDRNDSPLRMCEDFESALQTLFLGETNRQIAETYANDVSSRSHVIFTMHISSSNIQTGEIRESKLNFVDLAGSESVSQIEKEKQVTEAKFINLSLYYLHRVIQALQTKQEFIPYRLSALTLYLKDSLGGNTMTSMIAACHPNGSDFTLNTLSFAAQVMSIKNNARANISIDPQVLIQKLRQEIVRLRHELAVARGEEEDKPMDDDEKNQIIEGITAYIQQKSNFPQINPSRFKFAVDYIHENFANTEIKQITNSEEPKAQKASILSDDEVKKAISALQKKNKQYENEINVLVKMLNNRESKADTWTQTSTGISGKLADTAELAQRVVKERKPVDKKEAFQKFYVNHRKFKAIQLNKKVYEEKVEEAKKLSTTGKELKVDIESVRAQLNSEEDEEKRKQILQSLSQKMSEYEGLRKRLESIKDELATIDDMNKVNKKEVKRDFAAFWEEHYGKPNETNEQKTVSTSTATPAPEVKTRVGDEKADAIINQFFQKKEEIMRRLAESRQSKNRSSGTNTEGNQ